MDTTLNRQNAPAITPETISDRETGQLPGSAPLASAYVPFQKPGSNKYKQNMALIKGTLYPALNFPWHNKSNMTPIPDAPLSEVMNLGFVLLELSLYLDTHPNDTEAIQMHNMYLDMYNTAVAQYETMYGPLSHAMKISGSHNSWVNNPWPWDLSKKEE